MLCPVQSRAIYSTIYYLPVAVPGMPHYKERIESVIQEEMGWILLKEAEFPMGAMVTIMRAELSKDEEHITLWVSVLPAQFRDSVERQLKRMTLYLGEKLSKRVRMRFVPRIQFALDTGNDRIEEVDALLDTMTQ